MGLYEKLPETNITTVRKLEPLQDKRSCLNGRPYSAANKNLGNEYFFFPHFLLNVFHFFSLA